MARSIVRKDDIVALWGEIGNYNCAMWAGSVASIVALWGEIGNYNMDLAIVRKDDIVALWGEIGNYNRLASSS